MNCQKILTLNCFIDEFENVINTFVSKKQISKKSLDALDSQVNALNIAVNIINAEGDQELSHWTFNDIASNYMGYKKIHMRFKTAINALRNNQENKKIKKLVENSFSGVSLSFYQAIENQFRRLEPALKTCEMRAVAKLDLVNIKPQRGMTSSRIQALQKIIEPCICNNPKILKRASSPSLENKTFVAKLQQNHEEKEAVEVTELKFHQKKINALISYLDDERILETEGLFRVAPSQNELLLVEEEINKMLKAVSVYEISKEHKVHVISSLLKSAIREIPFPQDFTEGVVAVVENQISTADEKKGEAIRLFQDLAAIHQEIYAGLFGFLNKVIDHQGSNKMNAYNIAVVFALNFFPVAHSKDVSEAAYKGGLSREAFLLLLKVIDCK